MDSTMQRRPLLISTMLRYGSTAHGRSELITWTETGVRRVSYRQVGERAAQLAHALRGIGITGDQRVGTFMWNNAEHVIAYLAVPSMGAVLHAINIRLFPEQMAYVTRHGGSEVVIVDNSLAEPFSRLLPALPGVRHVVVNGSVPEHLRQALAAPEHVVQVHDWEEFLRDQPTTFDWPTVDENDGCAMCYTSGTTGNPKGVVYSHRSNYLHALTCSSMLAIGQPDRLLIVVPLFHANAWGYPYAAMISGASLVLPDRFLQPEPLARMISELQVTGGAGVPTVWNGLLQHLEQTPTDVSSCRFLMVGGSAAPPAMLRAFQQRHGIEMVQGWGMTELSPVGTLALAPGDVEADSVDYWRYRDSQGRLLPGVESRLAGPDGCEQPADGVAVGELEVRGPWVTGSYYANGTESEAEIADMAAKFDGEWLRTGDVGSLTEDSYLVLSDRAKDVIKSGGEWISSVDLENAIMGHPDVLEASVIGIPDEKWQERPLATVVLRDGATATVGELRDFLAGKIARWQLPDKWAFIAEVPKTSVGKFDKKALRQSFADGALEVQETSHR
ncbi:fatty acid--CoA ligase [Flexivirga sp.]|uniref:fatty acid--CoA ligase n=1 Tax=Flexivirga sp. TaxID=1962927 RepID=UPI003F80F8BE